MLNVTLYFCPSCLPLNNDDRATWEIISVVPYASVGIISELHVNSALIVRKI